MERNAACAPSHANEEKSNKYTSSIVTKYGDLENVKRDVKTLFEIMDRQGTSLLIDSIAEYAATTMQKFKLGNSDRAMTKIALVDELENAINERI